MTTEGDEEKEKEETLGGGGKGGSAASAIDVDVEEIEEMVDKITILEADVWKDVYGFQGVSELTSFEGDARYQRQGILKRWKEVPKQGYAEIDLLRLKTWCKDLRFSTILESTIDGNFTWHYAMIVIDPTATALKAKRSQHQRERVTSYTGFLQAFYEKGFLSNDISSKCMASALLMETSIIIVAKKVKTATKKGTDAAVTNTFNDAKQPKILVAVTFRRCFEKEDGQDIACAISWLLVAKHETQHSPQINGWRRQGLGLFALICMIKHCYVVDRPKQDAPMLDIYLQCYEASAFHFYQMLGFKQINSKNEDGFEELPDGLKKSYDVTSREPGRCVFHFFDGDDDEEVHKVPFKLLKLESGSLRHFKETFVKVTESESDSRAHKVWCQYPPEPVGGHQLQWTEGNLKKLFTAHPFIKWLLPAPLQNLLPYSACHLGGVMKLSQRIEHSNANGTAWMASGELDLLLSTILIDGRYQNFSFILPCWNSRDIKLGFEAYVKYQDALQYWRENKDKMTKADIVNAIQEKHHGTLLELSSTYLSIRNHLLKTVVHVNPGIISRRVIIIPCNEREDHWSVTFVFNASYIGEEEDGMLRPCFFRYCSLKPSGDRQVKVAQGIIWFLNLCYTYDVHEKNLLKCKSSKLGWCTPFGDDKAGNMMGTAAFPSLRLPKNIDILPRQNDDYNCGIGICSAIAIILRDIVFVDEKDNDNLVVYHDNFRSENMPIFTCDETSEVFCNLPTKAFKKFPMLPTAEWIEFLPRLREQWFSFLDAFAHFQHYWEPKRLNDGYVVDDDYTKACKLIEKWPTARKKGPFMSPIKENPAGDAKQVVQPRNLGLESEGGDKKAGSGDAKQGGSNANGDGNSGSNANGDGNSGSNSDDEGNSGSNSRKKPRFQPTPVLLVNGQFIRGSEVDLTDGKDVTEICYPLYGPLDRRLRKSKKRELDFVEDTAESLLKKIKAADPADAEELEQARRPAPPEKTKYCSQSKSVMEAVEREFGSEKLTPPTLSKKQLDKDIEAYIENSFIEWGWHSNKEHAKELENWEEMLRDETSRSHQILFKTFLKALRMERTKFRKHFADQYKFSQKTMVQSVKFDLETNTFKAALKWCVEESSSTPTTEVIDVEESWVRDQFGDLMVQQIINMRQEEDRSRPLRHFETSLFSLLFPFGLPRFPPSDLAKFVSTRVGS